MHVYLMANRFLSLNGHFAQAIIMCIQISIGIVISALALQLFGIEILSGNVVSCSPPLAT